MNIINNFVKSFSQSSDTIILMDDLKPREKLKIFGVDSLNDVELLGIIIGSGIKGVSYGNIAQKAMQIVRKVSYNKEALSEENFSSISGLGSVKMAQIIASIEFGKRISGYYSNKLVISSTNDSRKFLANIIKYRQEHLVALYLNARYELLLRKTVNIGTLNKVSVLPRDVLIPALEINAASIILAHNHPSGDSTPSGEDYQVTQRISDACKIIGITLLDHIVLSANGWNSIEIK